VNWQKILLGKTEVERRHALKDLSLRLPMRPVIRWFYMYLLLGGWRDGEAGFAWCTLQAFYEYLIVLKVKELKRERAAATATTIAPPTSSVTSPTVARAVERSTVESNR
jgi:hypothetical protein